ncbi:MAG: PAS domain S-box protein, partial [Gemmatimonadetes bacterium]|nr:PAS domain S-box protein [Gemmatimonadota bacterium]
MILALVGLAGVQELRTLSRSSVAARESAAVIEGLSHLRSVVIQSSNAQRGALLAGTDSALSFARAWNRAIVDSLGALDTLLDARSPARQQFDSLTVLVRARITTIERILVAREQGGFESARSEWLDAQGPLQQAAIERVISEMRTAEGTSERMAAAAVREGIRRALTLLVLGSLLGVALLSLAGVAMRRAWRELAGTTAQLEVALAAEGRSHADALAELQAQEEQYRRLVETLPQMIWTAGPDGRATFVSPQYADYTGDADVDAEGDARWRLIHPEDRHRFVAAWEQAMATGTPVREELRLQRHDGSFRWFETRAVPQRDGAGRLVQWVGLTLDIQEKRDLEEALHREQQRLQLIAEVAPAVLVSYRRAPDGRVTLPYAAASIAALYGFSPAELAVDAAPMLERVHPADQPGVLASITQSEAGMGPWHAEYRYLHPTRGEIWVEGFSSPLRDDDGGVTWHGVLLEVTARKQVEAQRDLWATAFTHCGHGIALGDPRSGRIVSCNPAFAALLGQPTSAIAGIPIPSLYAPGERAALLERIAEADRSGFCRYESEMVRANGTTLPVQVDLASVRGEDATVRFRVATIQDITERLRAARELERRAADLERSNTDLEQFAYVASHDLQEPLRAVAGCVQLLKKRYAGQLDARADEYIGYAVDGAVRMQRLIDDLLNYSRVGRAEGARQVTDTAELLMHALQDLGAMMQETGAIVTHDPMPVLSVYASQLSSVFQNLLGN